MIRTILRALWSHWWRNPVQLLAYVAGLALATGLWSAVQAINAEARASYAAAVDTLGEGQFDQLVPRDGNAIPTATYVALRRAGWLVSPVVEAQQGGVRLIGVDPVTAPQGVSAASFFDTGGNAPARSGPRLFANAETAAALGDLADVIVTERVAPRTAIGDIADVQSLTGQTALSRLILLPNQPRAQPPLEEVAPDLQRLAASQSADIAQLTDSFHLNLTAFGLLSFVVGLFIVHSTIGLAFEQRRGMIRTLRSLGVPLRLLILLISVEMLSFAILAAGLGILLGYLVAAALLPDVAVALQGLYGAQVSGVLQLRAEWWLSGFVLAVAGAALALSGRVWQIARMPLLASVRPRAWGMASAGRLRVQIRAGLILWAAAILLAIGTNGLISGFALLGCLLLGAALIFPVLADWFIRIMERRVHAPLLGWFWADTRQQLPGLSLALMALLLAVSANIGVATMVSSFRLTFIGFLDQRLAPELYIQVDNARDSASLESYLIERGLEVLPLTSVEAQIEGRAVRVFGMRVSPTYRDNWAFLSADPDIWDKVAAGEGLILNEQFARRADLNVGDRVTLAPDVALPIVGVVGDYGNPNAQVSLSETLFDQLYPGRFARQFGVRTDAPDDLRAAIAKDLTLPAAAMIDQSQLKAASLEVFERTFLVTGALNVLTLGVAGFAMLMSLLTLAEIRVPQLAPVWAIGIKRRDLGLMELVRAIALAALIFLCAIPVGLVLAWVLLSVVNVAAFGWKLPVFLFPREYVLLGIYTLLAAALAAAWPTWRLMRTPPSALLKVFSDER